MPPPLPSIKQPALLRKRIITAAVSTLLAVLAVCVFSVVVLRVFGLILPFRNPSAGMSPAIDSGDQIIMEGLTYLTGKPRRGDVIVFKTDKIPSIQGTTSYVKRLVGLPGDHLRLSKGILFINGQPQLFHNNSGEIHYALLPSATYLGSEEQAITVPDQRYFVLGDNSVNSADSRFWGFLPAESVRGRVSICYWPPSHIGSIR